MGPVLVVLQHIIKMRAGWLRRKLMQKELEENLKLTVGHRNQMQMCRLPNSKIENKQNKAKSKASSKS